MINLIKPEYFYLKSYLKACEDYKSNKVLNSGSFHDPEDFENWKDTIFKIFEEEHNGINLKEGYVPCSTFWLVDGKEYIGTGSIRHFLNEHLERYGGHIGYFIRYDKWKRGYGSTILKLLLVEAKNLGIKKVLITCDDTNIASAKIIKKNGGIYSDTIENFIDGENMLTKRYWITID